MKTTVPPYLFFIMSAKSLLAIHVDCEKNVKAHSYCFTNSRSVAGVFTEYICEVLGIHKGIVMWQKSL